MNPADLNPGADDMSIDRLFTSLTPGSRPTAGPSRAAARAARRRSRRGLRPAEVALLTRYRGELSGNVLEIGACGDGLTEILCHYAASYTGVALSPLGAELCTARFPEGFFPGAGAAELSEIPGGIFDVIVAGRGALDRLTAADRALVLAEVPRLLAPGGLLIFSSHNDLPEPRPLGVAGAFTLMEAVDALDAPLPSGTPGEWEIYLVAQPEGSEPRGWALLDAELV